MRIVGQLVRPEVLAHTITKLAVLGHGNNIVCQHILQEYKVSTLGECWNSPFWDQVDSKHGLHQKCSIKVKGSASSVIKILWGAVCTVHMYICTLNGCL